MVSPTISQRLSSHQPSQRRSHNVTSCDAAHRVTPLSRKNKDQSAEINRPSQNKASVLHLSQNKNKVIHFKNSDKKLYLS